MMITLWLTVWPILPEMEVITRLKIEDKESEKKYVFSLCIKCKLVCLFPFWTKSLKYSNLQTVFRVPGVIILTMASC